jgi:hypothetical protein
LRFEDIASGRAGFTVDTSKLSEAFCPVCANAGVKAVESKRIENVIVLRLLNLIFELYMIG